MSSDLVPQVRSESSVTTYSSHFGLTAGNNLGILASGLLEKRRDGAVRGGWTKRLFVLTWNGIYYFRRSDANELFGEERGHILLKDIDIVKVISPEFAPSGAIEPGLDFYFILVQAKQKSKVLFLRAAHLFLAQNWVNAITQAITISASLRYPDEWTPTDVSTYLNDIAGNNDQDAPDLSKKEEDLDNPHVIIVSVEEKQNSGLVSERNCVALERVAARELELENVVDLGALNREAVVILTLSDGRCARIKQSLLESMANNDENLVCSCLSINSSQMNVNLHLKITCKTIPFEKSSPELPLINGRSESTFPAALSLSFIISSLFLLAFASHMNILTKLTMFLGTLLAFCNGYQWKLSKAKPSITREVQVTTETLYRLQLVEIESIPPPPPTQEVQASPSQELNSSAKVLNPPQDQIPPVPQRFIDGEKGDLIKGKERWIKTLKWREENKMDKILQEPQRFFHIIKKYYPHYFHGRSKLGYPVYYEQPTKIDLKALKLANVTMNDLLRHYMFLTEYQWQVIEPSETGKSITVMDVSGVGWSDLVGEVLEFVRAAASFTSSHYPERAAHIYIMNIPSWFSVIWNIIKTMMDPTTREKTHMLRGSEVTKALLEHIDKKNIPPCYGGESVELGQSEEEIKLRDFVNKINEEPQES